MEKFNKFEIAARLITEEQKNLFLSRTLNSKLDNKELMDCIDTLKLAEEGHSPELLLSKEWQQGYECCKSRSQKKISEILSEAFTTANTRLSAAANLDVGGYIIDDLTAHSLLTEDDNLELIEELSKQTRDLKAKEFAMYDPEMHPDLGEFVKDGKNRLYYWSKDNLEKYP